MVAAAARVDALRGGTAVRASDRARRAVRAGGRFVRLYVEWRTGNALG